MVQTITTDKNGYIYAGTWSAGAYKSLNYISAAPGSAAVPGDFSLEQNYPNPFNPATKIRYSVPVPSLVVIKLYDIVGNEVAVLLNENKLPGNYELHFNSERYNLSSGVYLYSMYTGKVSVTKKLILIK
jgi:hypothetical protein